MSNQKKTLLKKRFDVLGNGQYRIKKQIISVFYFSVIYSHTAYLLFFTWSVSIPSSPY